MGKQWTILLLTVVTIAVLSTLKTERPHRDAKVLVQESTRAWNWDTVHSTLSSDDDVKQTLLAVSYRKLGYPALALEIYQQQDDVEALLMEGFCHRDLGQTNRAREAWELVLESEGPSLYRWMAYLQLGRVEEAGVEKERAVAAAPKSFTMGEGLLHYYLGQYELAHASIMRTAELDPPPSFHLAGYISILSGQYERALGEFRQAQAVRTSARDYTNESWVLYLLGRDQEAVASAREALEMDPKQSGAHHTLGLIQREAGDLEAALHHFDQAVDGLPNNPLYRKERAAVLQALGRSDAAAKDLEAMARLQSLPTD